eukprot:TRINITY_DN20946_c0_g1_i1.p1 TRINITY_DN20946_c0_g1~~TRINITY_DN20946_c0_g1_i1.p1  ORF type:complete len:222 (+),score=42.72 TRINITY_DN20946_c0_g1_i1:54-719(+)
METGVSETSSERSLRPSSFASDARGWWLVFCHERSFKLEHVENRQWLCQQARSKQGKCVCLRTVKAFTEWADTNMKRYVLIVGWRFAKPCDPSIERWPPAALCVLAETEKNLRGAIPWAAQRGATVLTSLDDITEEMLTVWSAQAVAETTAVLAPLPALSCLRDEEDDDSEWEFCRETHIPMHLANWISPALPARDELRGADAQDSWSGTCAIRVAESGLE